MPELFQLSKSILEQLKHTDCKSVKTQDMWSDYYTMTQWESYEDMRAFSNSGAHKKAMKMSKALAKEILVLSIESDTPITWEEAKWHLEKDGQIFLSAM